MLFLIFNRPEITAHVFEGVRRQQPRKLYVAEPASPPEVATVLANDSTERAEY